MTAFKITLEDGEEKDEIKLIVVYDPPLAPDATMEDLTPAQIAGVKLMEMIQDMLQKAAPSK